MLNDNIPAGSQILPFYLANGSNDTALIRGRIASVGTAAEGIIERHAYPDPVSHLQAEALALAACLSSTLKFDGVFTLQAKGDGLVRTLFATNTMAFGAPRSRWCGAIGRAQQLAVDRGGQSPGTWAY